MRVPPSRQPATVERTGAMAVSLVNGDRGGIAGHQPTERARNAPCRRCRDTSSCSSGHAWSGSRSSSSRAGRSGRSVDRGDDQRTPQCHAQFDQDNGRSRDPGGPSSLPAARTDAGRLTRRHCAWTVPHSAFLAAGKSRRHAKPTIRRGNPAPAWSGRNLGAVRSTPLCHMLRWHQYRGYRRDKRLVQLQLAQIW